MTNTNTASEPNIPTTAEQVALAQHARRVIGPYVEIRGRDYRVVAVHYDVRFYAVARYQGDIGPEAHVACLRDDLAVVSPHPGGYRDLALECAARTIVAVAMRASN